MKLDAKKLRVSEPTRSDLVMIKRRQIYIICDNILDTYNIGSIFRLADAVGVECIYLCGECETPPNIKIHRASIGTDKWVPWEYLPTAKEAIGKIRQLAPGVSVVAVEQDKRSRDFREITYKEPIAFVVGHETTGVSKEVLDLADEIVEIPMYGVNISLNVMVSLAIVLYQVI
ncbi:MAG: TrmH family RNA methyltransferase [Candidatus Curtissbacteria bacterium]